MLIRPKVRLLLLVVRIAIVYILVQEGDLPLYTTNDPATAVPTTGIITPVSSVYNDDRYNSSQFAGDQLFVSIKKNMKKIVLVILQIR